ncbi:MAG: hypothetical protein FJ197_05980 [Gammaproteobacteria bacterium]|nr:hypothetical protein [Gammaproteobacteria bacterium]
MGKIAVLAGTAVLGLSTQAFGYSASGNLTFSWGGNAGAAPFAGSANTAADVGWTSSGSNALANVTNTTYFNQQTGHNSQAWYNADFASDAECTGLIPASATPATVNATRKYGCRYNTENGTAGFVLAPVADAAATLTGASATGVVFVTDTTLTGTLTINSTTDEPTGATTTFTSATGVRLSNSVGNGFNGYNYRSADGSPFGNYWQGITTAGTLVLNLTGTFDQNSWSISGGTAKFTDNTFACQQGGNGATSDQTAGTLCTRSTTAGGQQNNGANLSWGWDLDGAATGTTAISMLEVRDSGGSTVLSTLSGVLASISVANGVLTTQSGEFRRGLGNAAGGCAAHLRYDGTKISCGTLLTGALSVSGTVVPVPAAVWLMGSALGLLGWMRRKAAA